MLNVFKKNFFDSAIFLFYKKIDKQIFSLNILILMDIQKEPTEKLLIIEERKYNSAGVLIINKYMNKDCVVLFKSALPIPSGVNKGMFYCDIPGGGIDVKDDSLEETASRELYEESKKLLSISKTKLAEVRKNDSFFDLPGRRLSGKRKAGLFACFVCRLSNVSTKYYNLNRELLKKVKIDKVFYETIEVVKIPINNIKEYFADKKLSDIKKPCEIKDVNNVIQYITVLASKCLFLACIKINNETTILQNSIKLVDYKEILNDLIEGENKGITIKYS